MSDEKKDRLCLGSAIAENTYPFIRKSANGELSGGIVSDDASKLPVCSGLLDLHHLEGREYEVREDIHMTAPYYSEDRSSPAEGRSGPANVNSADYLAGWDRIFGGNKTVGEA